MFREGCGSAAAAGDGRGSAVDGVIEVPVARVGGALDGGGGERVEAVAGGRRGGGR